MVCAHTIVSLLHFQRREQHGDVDNCPTQLTDRICICQVCFMKNIKVTNMKNTAEKSVDGDEDVVSLLRQKAKNYMSFASHPSRYPSQP